MSNKPLLIGYHTNISRGFDKRPDFDYPAKNGKGVDFILCHFDPGKEKLREQCKKAEDGVKLIKELGVDFIANFEEQNFQYDCVTEDGYDWASHGEGVHRLCVPKEYIDALTSEDNCLGIMYDEFEHVIINRNTSLKLASKGKIDLPVFPTSKNNDFKTQYELLNKQLKEYADGLKEKGAATVSGEHVFPVLFHLFARNGIIPNFKSQKESVSNVQFAIAAGAALQYKTELWNCVDMWYRMTFPGHTAEEMKNNLIFAYLTGVDRVYVESSHCFFDKDNKYNEIGKAFSDFADEYKGKERNYNVLDYKPEIGIIRCDDTFWGQGGIVPIWRYILFGNPKIKPDKKAKEYIKAFHTITHRETSKSTLSWDSARPFFLTKHRSFVSMNGATVFDETVSGDVLNSLKLCFLCGYYISEDTFENIKKLVKENGLTAVVPKRFAPEHIKSKISGSFCEIKDGNGVWIVTENPASKKLQKRLEKFTGKKGEMAYRFGENTVKMKIAKNGETFEII